MDTSLEARVETPTFLCSLLNIYKTVFIIHNRHLGLSIIFFSKLLGMPDISDMQLFFNKSSYEALSSFLKAKRGAQKKFSNAQILGLKRSKLVPTLFLGRVSFPQLKELHTCFCCV